MSNQYKAVLWNKQKKRYDLIMAIWIASFLLLFVVLNLIFQKEVTPETLIIRAFGIGAILLLHIILAIGPLSRINSGFLVLLYNRRHLGVTMFFMALIHGIFSIIQYHAFGNENPFISAFTSNTEYDSFFNFPFQVLGVFALIILFFMAATSHDFWLKNLGPRFWKSMHMMVYVAYGLLIMHVMLGAVQNETSPFISGMLLMGVLIISGLQYYSARISAGENVLIADWIAVGSSGSIPENGAKTVRIGENKVAVFKYDDKLSAVSNYCRHQGGPLGEGKIVDGCITCPWHGYQYYPHNGCSPPPFTEKIETYELKIEQDLIFLNPTPHPAGSEIQPISIQQKTSRIHE